jgi:hypothetical protein
MRWSQRTFTKSGPDSDHRGVNLISDVLPFGAALVRR